MSVTRRAPALKYWKWCEPSEKQLRMTKPDAPPAAPIYVDLREVARVAAHSGPQWGHECEDLDLTLLSWENGKRIEAHVNTEVDVVWIGVEGTGVATIDGQAHQLHPGAALLIPKGCERAVESTSQPFSYLSVHRRRRGLMPTIAPGRIARHVDSFGRESTPE